MLHDHDGAAVLSHQKNSIARGVKSYVLKRKAPTASAAVDQPDSPLFKLPLELRQEIWAYTLAFPDDTKPIHFHVYNEVIDSCTYEQPTAEALEKRRVAHHGALLRTCHAIYDEAVQKMYDDTHFELVLLAGHPRPSHPPFRDELPKGFHNIRGRNCVGEMGQWKNFKRLRHVTITVQPGTCPRLAPYTKRVGVLLGVLEQGKHLKSLRIKFNFAHNTDVMKSTEAIIKAFLPLTQHRDHLRGKLTLTPCGPKDAQLLAWITELQQALSVQDEPIMLRRLKVDIGDSCLSRGAHGAVLPPLSARAEVIIKALIYLTQPIRVPMYVAYKAPVMVLKGQTWRSLLS